MTVRVMRWPGPRPVQLERTTTYPETGRGPYIEVWNLDDDEWGAIVAAVRRDTEVPLAKAVARRRSIWRRFL